MLLLLVAILILFDKICSRLFVSIISNLYTLLVFLYFIVKLIWLPFMIRQSFKSKVSEFINLLWLSTTVVVVEIGDLSVVVGVISLISRLLAVGLRWHAVAICTRLFCLVNNEVCILKYSFFNLLSFINDSHMDSKLNIHNGLSRI